MQKQHYNECLKDQITMRQAKELIEKEKRRAMQTDDPKEREQILKDLRDKIRKIVKCKRCFRVISERIVYL